MKTFQQTDKELLWCEIPAIYVTTVRTIISDNNKADKHERVGEVRGTDQDQVFTLNQWGESCGFMDTMVNRTCYTWKHTVGGKVKVISII